MMLTLSKSDNESSTHYADVYKRFRTVKREFKYTKNHSFSRHTLLMTVSEIKYETILLTIDCYFIISELEKVKNKRVSLQLSDITESVVRNIITDKYIQQNIVSDSVRDKFTAVKDM